MPRTMPAFLGVAACVALLFTTWVHPAAPEKPNEGREWLTWSPEERQIYVQGFIVGFWRGSNATCRLADDLFEVGKSHREGEAPSDRCQARVENYTKIKTLDSGYDFSAYTAVITDFYTKHPEYQNIPKVYLLSLLTDRNYKTADQLYQMALKGEMLRACFKY